ncbi:hypothetical protein LEP1GSC017_3118 [Leptospira meyeri serovar Hardjo str. Went 5]|nr:hypothetical protein LEP1GSC017_3118 [Leptospira meyeri serovar Hardjo str. Went 5]
MKKVRIPNPCLFSDSFVKCLDGKAKTFNKSFTPRRRSYDIFAL